MNLPLFLALLLFLPTNQQPIQQTFLDVEQIRDVVEKEVESMGRNPDFFYSYNVFYSICTDKIAPVLDTLLIDDENSILFCKMIENALPNFFLSILKINSAENNKIVQTVILEFFKVYQYLHFDIDRIRLAKLFHSNVSILYRIKGLFQLPESVLDALVMKNLPVGVGSLNAQRISTICDKFVDFLVYKVVEKVIEFLYENPRLFAYTLFEMFEKPFEIVTDFNNDMEFITHNFNLKYRNRRLYLLDSLDNLALKSLNIFKNDESQHKLLEKALAKQAHQEHPVPHHDDPFAKVDVTNEPEFGLRDISLVTPELIALYEESDYIEKDFKENEEGSVNYKLINNCVKNSQFKSQSLEKIYCYAITKEIKQDAYLVETPVYNERLGIIFSENSAKHAPDFIDLEASYFAEESIYNENIYPKFRETLESAAEDFRKSVRQLRKDFYEENVKSVKMNFMYTWNKIVNRFFTQSISLNEVSHAEFQTNILNFADFTDELWFHRIDSEYFKLDAFFVKFSLRYKKNLEKFSRYK